MGGKSTLTFETGLKPGVYRLLCLRTPEVPINGDTVWNEFGLGCRVEISETDTARVLDYYSKVMKMSGHGTEDDPFIVSSPDHLKRLRSITNDQIKNNLLLPKTHFRQMADIDMDKASWDSDHEFGWLAIGNMPNNPFRGIYDGNGYRISNLWAKRGNSAGIGLLAIRKKLYSKISPCLIQTWKEILLSARLSEVLSQPAICAIRQRSSDAPQAVDIFPPEKEVWELVDL